METRLLDAAYVDRLSGDLQEEESNQVELVEPPCGPIANLLLTQTDNVIYSCFIPADFNHCIDRKTRLLKMQLLGLMRRILLNPSW